MIENTCNKKNKNSNLFHLKCTQGWWMIHSKMKNIINKIKIKIKNPQCTKNK